MKALRSISKDHEAALRKTATTNEKKMEEIRTLIFQICQETLSRISSDTYLANMDYARLYREIYNESATLNMRPKNITTYYWLFGFKNHARNYINSHSGRTYNYANRPNITKFNIHCIFVVLNHIGIINGVSCPILINNDETYSDDYAIEFLRKVRIQISGQPEKASSSGKINDKKCTWRKGVKSVLAGKLPHESMEEYYIRLAEIEWY